MRGAGPKRRAEGPGRLSALMAQLFDPGAGSGAGEAIGLARGSRVGRFEILRELSRGGFGVVYEAFDPELARKVAIKMLRPSRHALDAAQRERLREEAEAVARLDHPSIVTVHDAGTCASGPYLVLELLRGEPLDARIARGPLPPREALRVATEVAKALAHAHGRGVLHRDLKPANVFLTEDGRVKLLDFGLAHLLGSADRHRGGTAAYMAPEQARDEPVDARADVFAFGVMAYETLEGRRPFEVREGRSAALDGAAPAPFSLPFPAPISSFVARCLSPDPGRRPPSGLAVLEELLALERSLGAAAAVAEELPSASLTKIARPQLPPVFARERLFHRLDDRSRARRVVWVQGPPGAGKTTLVASWVAARRLRTLWYQIDEGDVEVGTFFHYLGAAARDVAGGTAPLPAFRAEAVGNLDAFARRWFRELYARLGRRFAIVLDNYHAVPADAPLHAAVRDALEELPHGGRAVLVSRTEPVPALARLRADAMVELGSDELRLTPAESRGIARVRSCGRPARVEVDRLHGRIQGWAAGLVLLLERARSSSLDAAADEQPEAVFDYFAGEIFERADPATQEVLLQAAFLTRFTASMVERLTGSPRAARILAELARRGYFTTRSGVRDAHYQFHPLFREFLLARASRTLAPDRLTALRLAAAGVLRDAGDAEGAAALYREMERWDELAELVLSHARALHRAGRGETLWRWIGCIPAGVRDRRPWLRYWLGMAQLSLDPTMRLSLEAAPRAHFERSFEQLSAAGDAAGAYLSFAAATVNMMSEIWASAATIDQLDAWIDRFEQLRSRFPSPPSPGVGARATLGYLTALLLRRPGDPDYPLWRERVMQVALGSGRVDARIAAGNAIVQALLTKGELADTQALIAALGPLARARDVYSWGAVIWLCCESSCTLCTGDHELALRVAAEARALSAEVGLRAIDWLAYYAETLAWIVADVPAEASSALARVREAISTSRLDSPPFEIAGGVLALRTGAIAEAMAYSRALLAAGERTRTPLFTLTAHLLAARAAAHGRPAEDAVRTHLDAARRVGTAASMALAEYVASLTEAQLALGRGDRARAIEGLRRALPLDRGRGFGFFHRIWFRPRESAELCALALEHGIEPEYARSLLRPG